MHSKLEELVDLAKQGDIRAKKEVLDRVEGLIVNKIKRYGAYKSRLDYEDLLQDGKMVVLESIDNYDSDYGVYFLGFLKSKLRYLYLNKYKSKDEGNLSLNFNSSDGSGELLSKIEDENSITGDKIEKEEMTRELQKALEALTDREREVIMLYYYYDLNMKEIAKKLNRSYRAVVNRKTRAMEKLKNKIKKIY